jgi:hypothetical protein
MAFSEPTCHTLPVEILLWPVCFYPYNSTVDCIICLNAGETWTFDMVYPRKLKLYITYYTQTVKLGNENLLAACVLSILLLFYPLTPPGNLVSAASRFVHCSVSLLPPCPSWSCHKTIPFHFASGGGRVKVSGGNEILALLQYFIVVNCSSYFKCKASFLISSKLFWNFNICKIVLLLFLSDIYLCLTLLFC